VAASYGAVYAALTANGHRMYIADGNHEQEFAYEHGRDGWRQTPISDGIRFSGRRAIREYILEIAQRYHFDPPF
jgi:hypothetical protein